jgi:hypothetical protein
MSGVKRAARWTEVVVIVGIIQLLVGVALPPRGFPTKAREAEIKQSLHNLQLAVEKYAVDHNGAYPAYLTGGEARWTAMVYISSRSEPFSGEAPCPALKQVTDPLLSGGYMTVYPRNPFAKNGVGVHNAQLTMPLDAPGGDPLRNGVDTGRLYGTRFGAYCTSTGQLLGAKYYFLQASAESGVRQKAYTVATAPIPGLPPSADVTYPCWDVWSSSKARNPLPGEFIYAGTGPVIAVGNASGSGQYPILPTEIDSYILAAFGGPRTKGKDIMDLAGIPFRLPWHIYDSYPQSHLAYGNPDGIKDGIIIAITPGE